MPGRPLNITLPVVGITPGTKYAELINDAFTSLISDIERKVLFSDILANQALDLKGNYIVNVGRVKFSNLNAALSSGNAGLFEVSGELYYQDELGNNVQITNNGSINSAALGNIISSGSPAYGTGGIQLLWSGLNNKYVFSDPNPAEVELGTLALKTSANTTKLKSSSSVNYTITLPQKPLSNGGVLSSDIAGLTTWSKDLSLDSVSATNDITSSANIVGKTVKQTDIKEYNYNTYSLRLSENFSTASNDTIAILPSGSPNFGKAYLPLNFPAGSTLKNTSIRVLCGTISGTWQIKLKEQETTIAGTKASFTYAVNTTFTQTLDSVWNIQFLPGRIYFLEITTPSVNDYRQIQTIKIEIND